MTVEHLVAESRQLPQDVRAELIERLMLEVCEHPQIFRQFDPPARRHFSDRFPYGVIYLIEPDNLWVVAVMQLNREPSYGRERLS